MKKTALIFSTVFLAFTALAQEDGIIRMHEFAKANKRKVISIPDVKNYQVIKADFHMHTVFSDGQVWPNVRIQEAWREGLDAISITDHVEILPFRHDVKVDNTRSYELAKNMAAENNIILIKGTEITRNTPPGHFNALFIEHSDDFIVDLDSKLDEEAIGKVINQNAFIFWDHPGWRASTIDGSYEWIDFVDRLYESKALGGIEVFNGFSFFTKALDWAIDKNLAVIGNTDIHNLVAHTYDLEADHVNRTMTLVFAKDRTQESIREALEAGRTVAWASKHLAGKEEHVVDLFHACVTIGDAHHSVVRKNQEGQERTTKYYEITNDSDLYFELALAQGEGTEKVVLSPASSQVITAPSGQKNLSYTITSAFIRSDQHPVITLPLNE